MKLLPVVIFLSWSAVGSFLRSSSAAPEPGVLVRLSERGIQYAATKIMDRVDRTIDRGMRFPDLKDSFQLTVGSIDYTLSEIHATNFNWHAVSGDIIPGVGVKASFHKISVSIDGRFNYVYVVWSFPTSNSGTFNLTLSDVSFYVNATSGMTSVGQPTVDFPGCYASIGDMDLNFEARHINWIMGKFTETIKSSIKPTLLAAICKAVKDAGNLIAPRIANYTRPCLDRSCHYLIDLRFASPPVFSKDFIEMAFQGQISSKSDPSQAPLNALPFQRSLVSHKMADVYVNAYVFNTLLYSLHRNDLLTYEFTNTDLPLSYRHVMNTSCQSFCIGKIFPDVFAPRPEATVELDVVATRRPFLTILHDSCSITFAGNINVQMRSSSGSVTTLGVVTLQGSVEAQASFSSDGRFTFLVRRIEVTSASFSDAETTGNKGRDVADQLRSAVRDYFLPELNAFGQKGFSNLSFGHLSASSPYLRLIQNAFLLTTDVTFSDRATTV